MKQVLLGFFVVLLAGCMMPSHVTHAQSQDVHIRIDGQFNPERCEYKGEVTGSEGHWYNYIFMTNDAMMQGAMNDLKNNAEAIGADTVFMVSPQDFITSFSVLGSAYLCDE
ncbi:DUF4156 domain-containing protein [Vibrio parahaemolyticus]|uniref:DUF4156 domain-containing protein n=1 Tax=Vibrio parahaemolyticus TaxID=670 RepID=UPI00111CE988|nr:DUF4156 domain-containing protein [Vibrio parahaemolyticus]MDF4675090.1 DUF4156 domain-containing protein [Vibrio parahaemolyticus]MDF4699342.1 DUF4156 domain-containing protein [Vibrio parahaemolyticus]TON08293.1 hypothetical protein CGH63_20815 [Vibrio parahaemolyticus]TOO35521.1 hypothetical protein CGH39_21490 [Vibrio parahaemolyticus]TOP28211.1 hypothetical protein CGH20_17105 [Vibrio parahaemolyticus]